MTNGLGGVAREIERHYREPRPCPGCRRPRSECWIMPCLYLEGIIAKGRKAVERWARPGGGRVVSKPKA